MSDTSDKFILENPVKGLLAWKTPPDWPRSYPRTPLIFVYPEIGYRVRRLYPTRDGDVPCTEDDVFVVVGWDKMTQTMRIVEETRSLKYRKVGTRITHTDIYRVVREKDGTPRSVFIDSRAGTEESKPLHELLAGLTVRTVSYADGNWEILHSEGA